MAAVVLLNGSRAASKSYVRNSRYICRYPHRTRWISAGTWHYLLEGHLGEGPSLARLVLAGISQQMDRYLSFGLPLHPCGGGSMSLSLGAEKRQTQLCVSGMASIEAGWSFHITRPKNGVLTVID